MTYDIESMPAEVSESQKKKSQIYINSFQMRKQKSSTITEKNVQSDQLL
jgi:hypothetical protein